MARQIIDIGIQGNDGTGDSIRESFRKVNDNFAQIFSIFGTGDIIAFTDLDDTPDSYSANQIILANESGDALVAKDLIGGAGILVDNSDPFQVRIISTGGKVEADDRPRLGNHLDGRGFAIGRIEEPSDNLVEEFNTLHQGANATIDEFVLTKGYADRRYLQTTGGTGIGGQVRIRQEPTSRQEYFYKVDAWLGGYAIFTTNPNGHGFNTAINGAKFVYNQTVDTTIFPGAVQGTAPAGYLINGGVYNVRFVDIQRLSLHPTRDDAVNDTNRILVNVPPLETEVVERGDEYLVDFYYNEDLEGNWLSNEALPRESVVRRQGDRMDGTLYLEDHPGSLAGAGSPNGIEDYQAATKFYVDSSSFASAINLFVATSGDDEQPNTPPGKEGRAFAYAYSTVGAACQKAEEIINDSLREPGPYRQRMTYGAADFEAYLTASNLGPTSTQRNLEVWTNGQGINQSKDPANRDLREGSIIKGIRSGATGKVIQYTNQDDYDNTNDLYRVELLHKISDITTFEANYFFASDRLAANKDFIAAEVVAYVTTKYPSLEYSEATCLRDAKFIVEALKNDIKFGGNKNTIKAAKSYWRGAVSILPTSLDPTIDQLAPTLDAIEYLFKLAEQVIQNNTIPLYNPPPGSDTPDDVRKRSSLVQNTLGSPGEDGSIALVERLIDAVLDIVENGINGSGILLDFIENEPLEYGQLVPEAQITIRIESGIYYEQLPIRLPSNCSIKGDEFRRSIIRPAPGESLSPWARIYFYREDEFDGLTRTYTSTGATSSYNAVNDVYEITIASTEGLEIGMYLKVVSGTGLLDELTQVKSKTATTFVISIPPIIALSGATIRGLNSNNLAPSGENFGYHYLIDPSNSSSRPKENKDMDVFLLNDATILRNITCQGHGGFMCVLDPEGQIQTKSPYFQTCTSLSGSTNSHRFAGGMFVDGFNGNLPATINSKNSNTELILGGLTKRPVQVPNSFYINGSRYQINIISNYNPVAGTATVVLDEATPYTGSVSSPIPIITETPGNRSMLANDFTQVNDLGYGCIATNNGITELVSVFTYYNYTSYYALNGSQIRSVAGNSSNGVYGMRAKGGDPNEVPDPVILSDNTVQVAKIYKREGTSSKNLAGDQSIYIDYYQYIPYNISEIEIDHSNTKSSAVGNTPSSPNNITIVNPGSGYSLNDLLDVDGGILYPGGSKTRIIVKGIGGGGSITSFEVIEAGIYSVNPVGGYPTINGNVTTTAVSPSVGTNAQFNITYLGNIVRYEVSNSESTTETGGEGVNSSGIIITKPVIKLNLNSSASLAGLAAPLVNGQTIIIRSLQNLKFYQVEEVQPVRPSTALEFTSAAESGTVYRTLAYNLSGPLNSVLAADEAILTFDSSYDYVIIQTNNLKISDTDYVDGGLKKMGSAAGDTRIAVQSIASQDNIDRLNSGEIIFGWRGKLHRVTSYVSVFGSNSAYINFVDLAYGSGSVVNLPATGIAEPFSVVESVVLRGGVRANAPAQITVRISTCRASGHDFLDVGTGGFNTTNYPNNLLGAPSLDPVPANEVIEEGEGRVFYVSTDQDGIFRVGRFFTVDQGTGTVTFSASIALSNLDGIGFKRGTVVKEFSTDSTMTDNADDTVPTESAVRGYIEKRLGISHTGAIIPASDRIPINSGFLPLNQTIPLTTDLDLGGYRIINLSPNINSSSDAATIGYVNTEVAKYDTLAELREVNLTTPSAGSIMIFPGLGNYVQDGAISGDIGATVSTPTTTTLIGGYSNFPTLDSGILNNEAGDGNVDGGIELASATAFPNSGFIRINNEIFGYTDKTGNRLDGCTRAKFLTTSAVHSAGSTVVLLNNLSLDLQLQPEVIVNGDVSPTAAIAQSKLNLTNVTAYVDIATTTSNGIAQFSSDNFNVSVGVVSIKNGGVSLAEIQNIAAGSILGNLTGSAAAPQEVTTSGIVENGINNIFTTIDSGAFVLTRRFNSLKTSPSSTFVSILGNAPVGSGTINNLPVTSITGSGVSARVNVTYSSGGYNSITVAYGGNNYAVGNQLKVDGALFTGGLTGTNDLFFTIESTPGNIDNTVYFGLEKTTITAEANSIVKTDSSKNLGNPGDKFNNIYASSLYGNLAGNSAGLHTGDVVGDIYASNSTSKILENGTNGSDATFTGNVTGNLTGTVLTANQPNITSIGTLSSLNVSGATSLSTLTTSGFHAVSIDTAITATGTTQATAYAITKTINNIVNVNASSRGIRLPTPAQGALAGTRIIIRNATNETLYVYPGVQGSILDAGNNIPYILDPPSSSIEFFTIGDDGTGSPGGKWYFTLNAIFA